MSPVKHVVTAPALTFSLPDETRTVREQLAAGAGERSGRTLIKDGPLRVTLVGLNAGGRVRSDKADGPITMQVLEGSVELDVEGQRLPMPAGSLLALDAGVPHTVSSTGGALFLLTVVHTEEMQKLRGGSNGGGSAPPVGGPNE